MTVPARLFAVSDLRFRLSGAQLLLTLAILGLSFVVAFGANDLLGEVGSALVLVLGIMLAGATSGLAAAILAAFAAFLLYNFYLAEPVLTFRLATGRDIAPLVAFNLCALMAGILAGRPRNRAESIRDSNRRLASLLAVSEALQGAASLDDIERALSAIAAEQLTVRLALHRWRAGESDCTLTRAVCGGGASPLRSSDAIAYRLDGGDGPIGALVFQDLPASREEEDFLTALANVTALALARVALAGQIAESRAAARTEELKTALFSSISHDFRTPLTAISASASSLIAYRAQLDEETSQHLLRSIVDECDRLNRFTANLLEISRLQAGQMPVARQVLGVDEMIGAAVQQVRPRAGSRRFLRGAAAPDLQVAADAALFELVLVNVLENAIRYSADGSTISIAAQPAPDGCRIAIEDEGLGIPGQDLERVFDRFYRVPRAEASPQGSGLGLAIAKGFVEALGGSIRAESPARDGQGTRILIHLPLVEAATR